MESRKAFLKKFKVSCPNTWNRVEITTCSGVFLPNIDLFLIMVKHYLAWFDIYIVSNETKNKKERRFEKTHAY